LGNKRLNNNSHTNEIPLSLEVLRLHKYASIFAYMSYDDMMNMTEQDLEQRNITKGARQKLFLSIQKLRARSAVLLASERELFIHHHWESISLTIITKILFQIRAFLSTPIRPVTSNDDGDDNNGSMSVDVNNNNNQSIQTSVANQILTENNNDLTSIIVRLIGHGMYDE
ncbi:hypothetical protein BLA29_004667, partial [Euroglyphus maynei]